MRESLIRDIQVNIQFNFRVEYRFNDCAIIISRVSRSYSNEIWIGLWKKIAENCFEVYIFQLRSRMLTFSIINIKIFKLYESLILACIKFIFCTYFLIEVDFIYQTEQMNFKV